MRSRRAPRSPPGHAREHWPRTIAIEGAVMAVVVMHAVASMDGYIADTDDEVGIWSWCHIDRSRTGGIRKRRVTSSMM
jgi:hypothetical protein